MVASYVYGIAKNHPFADGNEYRLLSYASMKNIPKFLKCEPASEMDNNNDTYQVYMDTEILQELDCVITAPKLTNPQVLTVQYCLDAHRELLEKPEEPKIRRSRISYQ